MKLISCYVENFGNISQKDFVFDKNLTTVCKENGAGKSTLACFIKSMFYGLESYKVNTVGFSERRRYYPFNQGAFGGNLTFSFENKTYKIERFFGEKSDTQDTLKVYVDGVVTDRFGDDIGKTVFGIDKQSFERTAFIGSEEIEIKSTSSINAKLNNFLQGASNSIDFDGAVSSLEKIAKEYKKSKQGKDKITYETEKINALEEKISNVLSVRTALENKREELNGLQNEISKTESEIAVLQKNSQLLSEWEHYEHLLSVINNSNEKINQINEEYKNGLPSQIEVDKVSELLVLQRELSAKIVGGLSVEESDKLNKLTKIFEKGVPTESEINLIQNDIETLSNLNSKMEFKNDSGLSAEEKTLLDKFSLNKVDETFVDSLTNNVTKYKNLTKQSDNVFDYKTQTGSGLKLYGTLAIAFFVLGFIGLPLLFINQVLGVLIIATGFSLTVLTAFLYLNKKLSKTAIGKSEGKLKFELLVKGEEQLIAQKLSAVNYLTDNGILYDYAVFLSDFTAYNKILLKLKDIKTEANEIQENIKTLKTKLYNFFIKYHLTNENYLSNLTRLQSGILEYQNLLVRKNEQDKNKKEIEIKLENVSAEIKSFSQKYALKDINTAKIIKDINEVKALNTNSKNAEDSARIYKEEKNLTVKPSVYSRGVEELNEQLSSLQKRYGLLKYDIVSDEYLVDKLDGLTIDKEVALKNLNKYKNKHKLLLSTVDALKKADQNLKDKYVAPVKYEFEYYAGLLESVLKEKVTMTKDFEVYFERFGKQRGDEHLSSGIKSICALCFRLALIKNMYKNQKPFLVLDDPFVNLDGVHFEKVTKLLNELSKDIQIIYFTCHESRII